MKIQTGNSLKIEEPWVGVTGNQRCLGSLGWRQNMEKRQMTDAENQ